MTDSVTISGHAHGHPLNYSPADTLQIIRQINAAVSAGDGSSDHLIKASGSDTLTSSHGNDTIDATGAKSTFVDGKGEGVHFTFLGGAGPATVLGGTGSHAGPATVLGGPGSQLFAEGPKAQILVAGAGNETLSAAQSTGHVTLVGGSGKDVLVGGKGPDVFEFIKGQSSGGRDLILNFDSNDKVLLSGYGPDEVSIALAHQSTHHGSVSITLSDDTKITFKDVASLKSSNFS